MSKSGDRSSKFLHFTPLRAILGLADWRKARSGMRIFRTKEFKGDRPWAALDVANMSGITSRIHWTNEPYHWHVNDGEEVFAVLDGCVEMKYRQQGVEKSILLNTGDVFFAEELCEHVAHPQGEARILVIEKEGSV